MIRALALVACGVLAPFAMGGELELLSVYGRADPLALAVDEQESVLVLVDGCVISVRAQSKEAPFVSQELRSTTLDATVFDLALDDDDLYVAGGSFGLFRVDWREPAMPATRIVGTPDGVCTSVALTPAWLHATIKTAAGSRWLTIARKDMQLVHDFDLGEGVALDLVAAEDRVWIAMGLGGAVSYRVDALSGTPVRCGTLQAGNQLASMRQTRPLTIVRDLAHGGELLHAAGSATGIASPWNGHKDSEPLLRSIASGKPNYALRVAANDERWFMACLRGPADVADGAPYGLAGVIGLDLDVGDVALSSLRIGTRESIQSGTHEVPLVVENELALPACGFRALEAGPSKLYAQLLKLGARVWSCEEAELRELWAHRPNGQPMTDGVFSLADLDVVLFGSDSQGSFVRGLLEVNEEGALALRSTSRDERPLGLRVGAQWLDEANDCEWFVAGAAAGWQLIRFQPGADRELTRWNLLPPVDPDGERGITYFSSTKHGDLLLGTRSGSRYGLVAWSVPELVKAALVSKPGTKLEAEVLFQQLTGDTQHDKSLVHAWSAALVTTREDRTLVVIPAGREPDGETAGRSRALVLELAEDGTPTRRALLTGATDAGHAICCDVTTLGERTVAAIGDLGGSVELWDITLPEEADRIATWEAPANDYDGRRDSVLDLGFIGDGDQQELLVAAGRAGLVQLSLDQLHYAQMQPVGVHDTPGWAVGVATQRLGDTWRVLVGDQKCGARMYGWKPGSESEDR